MTDERLTTEKALRSSLRELMAQARSAGEFSALSDEWRKELLRAGAGLEKSAGDFRKHFGMIGESAVMQSVYELLAKVAPTHVPVLILGETGTGKELIARGLHNSSPRAGGPFQAENCAAVSPSLLESELFGHVKGSFTGAIADRKGTFVSGDKGTVFLDEIGDMPLDMQSKLLRVLQDGEVRPVGSNKVVRVDVRLVAATNKNLEAMCAEKSFREDLYYRLNVVTVRLPPLRERAGDVALLVRFFSSQLALEFGRELEFTEAALAALEAWNWPGNVRELENELQRAAVFAEGPITPQDLSPHLIAGGKGT